jgi:DNA-binding MarR family transcriptional regulator
MMAVDRGRQNQQIATLLHEVTSLVDRVADRTLREDADLTLSQFLFLLGVDEKAAAPTQQHIAVRLGIDRAAVSRQLDRLERKGFVAREGDGGRSNTVRLTTTGIRALRRAQRAMQREMTRHYTAPTDPDSLVTGLRQMRDSLLDAR